VMQGVHRLDVMADSESRPSNLPIKQSLNPMQ